MYVGYQAFAWLFAVGYFDICHYVSNGRKALSDVQIVERALLFDVPSGVQNNDYGSA